MTNKNNSKKKNGFKQKTWVQTKAHDSWSVFKIMAEIVEGYEELARIWSLCGRFWFGTYQGR